MNPSLQKRLTWQLALLLVVAMAIQWGVVEWVLDRIIYNHVTSRLAHDAHTILAQTRVHPGHDTVLVQADPIYQQPWSGHYYALKVGGILLRSRSLWDNTLPLPEVAVGSEILSNLVGPRQQPLLVLTRSFVKLGSVVTISVAEDMTSIHQGIALLQFWHAMLSLLAIGVLLILQRWTLRRGLQPLNRACMEIQRLERGEVEMLHTVSVPVEILPFILEINRLVATLLRRLQRARHATSNLAHAIKTPLTILLQLGSNPCFAVQTDLQETLRRQVEAIRQLTDRELKRVRSAGSGTPTRNVDIQEELAALVAVLKLAHQSKEVIVSLEVPTGLVLPMDREDLLELAGNLLDNACKWARSRVDCRVASDAGVFHLTVEDDGPGCPDDQLQHIPERGVRTDTTKPGFGMGLDIVCDIVEDYDGQLTLGKSKHLSGFSAQVKLRLATP
ncbi:MAG: GHKL domain-containing protein [Magnetococcales bacterium]|nr:GHKL domain-containing protein [Magnetococcales bacterium]MBF0322031.1 GHKL domain-containing protein [Magnetococcales bacterium]